MSQEDEETTVDSRTKTLAERASLLGGRVKATVVKRTWPEINGEDLSPHFKSIAKDLCGFNVAKGRR